ncbi:GNAT family N-acetyltransferase [Mycobacteroides chelonae]|uniref:GNAT family N-acetyltransferase n=2 Tax=Mycobacteroides chelonae TaxID=1774 RepID=A0AB73U5J2_MYCCH|nr:GNAT family N-acetyltransferase [Mycobacteroides chelonae]MEC4842615.1 GNAT family N-acetyltransferase [Mycobacteroides chelonae]MEC4847456.1 GNAT family N-acetyltransferase [Mycobacteroides chelonae]OLT80538.1 GNAT family N-acetyltransferase [Mycobacteroides chelonae]QDF71912.1 GNAT family N-acetyltransferase [Mycobacteroides chelonae]WED90786.1 GNAT family N-acetyltransferase [Mycobacteroides chelonae]
MHFESARLEDDHLIEGFDCGKESLNTWLVNDAMRADSSGIAHVYAWTQLGEPKVCAYFAICPTLVYREEDGVPRSLAGGYSSIPGFLIARLALDKSLRGKGYGEHLLVDALGKAVAASEIGAGRLIVVDALDDEAAEFYKHYGFTPVKNRERRLVMKVSTAAKALGERWRD